jgi:hypothetical protein
VAGFLVAEKLMILTFEDWNHRKVRVNLDFDLLVAAFETKDTLSDKELERALWSAGGRQLLHSDDVRFKARSALLFYRCIEPARRGYRLGPNHTFETVARARGYRLAD